MAKGRSVSKLGKLRENAGFEQKDIAAKYNVDASYISRLETGKVGLTGAWAQRFARDYNMSLDDIFGCFSDAVSPAAYAAPPSSVASSSVREECLLVPVYHVPIDGKNHAPSNDASYVTEHMAFSIDWLQRRTRAEPGDLALFKVHGDSMEPLLKGGDCVLADRTQQIPAGGDIFVIEQEGVVWVKRLAPLPGGAILVMSENERYPDYEMVDGTVILGRAIYRMGDL